MLSYFLPFIQGVVGSVIVLFVINLWLASMHRSLIPFKYNIVIMAVLLIVYGVYLFTLPQA